MKKDPTTIDAVQEEKPDALKEGKSGTANEAKAAAKAAKTAEKSGEKAAKKAEKAEKKAEKAAQARKTGKAAKEATEKAGEAVKNTVSAAAKTVADLAGKTGEAAVDAALKVKAAVVDAIDVNDNGKIDIEDLIIQGLRLPGVGVNREEFLRRELHLHPTAVVDAAVATTPFRAGIGEEELDKLADEAMKYERTLASGIAAALAVPPGMAALLATVPADIMQYYGYLLRATQKLLYLYGYPQLAVGGAEMDTATLNLLILCMGVMYGVNGAGEALRAVTKALGLGVEKRLLQKALTKGAIYPFVKKVAGWFNVSMTKKIAATATRKGIALVGVVLSAGITYVSFKSCCDKLQATLRSGAFAAQDDPADELIPILLEEEAGADGAEG